MTAAPKIEPHWLKQTDMAKGCGVSVNTFRKWGIEPAVKVGRCNYYDVGDVLKNRLADLESQHQSVVEKLRDKKLSELDIEKINLTRAQAIAQDLKNAERLGELAPIEFLTQVLARAANQVNSVLDSLPLAIRRRVPSLTARHIEFVKKEVVKCQNAMSRTEVDFDECVKAHNVSSA